LTILEPPSPQAALFHSIKPLFANKPVLIVVNKIDTRRLEVREDRGTRDGPLGGYPRVCVFKYYVCVGGNTGVLVRIVDEGPGGFRRVRQPCNVGLFSESVLRFCPPG
jgi:hypothetical protein